MCLSKQFQLCKHHGLIIVSSLLDSIPSQKIKQVNKTKPNIKVHDDRERIGEKNIKNFISELFLSSKVNPCNHGNLFKSDQ